MPLFHCWTDYKWVTFLARFLVELLEWGDKFSGFLRNENYSKQGFNPIYIPPGLFEGGRGSAWEVQGGGGGGGKCPRPITLKLLKTMK